MLFRKKLLLAKVETTYGTDATPTGAEAIRTRNLAIAPFQGNTRDLDYDRPTLGADKTIYTSPHTQVTFETDLVGSGTAGDVPNISPLLRACSLSETIDAGVSVAYAPIAENQESATLYFYLDGELHALTGCRGEVEFALNRDDIPVCNWTFLGQRVAPVDQPNPTPNFATLPDPLPVNKANTTTASLFAYDVCLEALSLSLGNQTAYRDLPNCKEIVVFDREGSGSITIEKPTLTEKDFDAEVFAHSIKPLNIVHGVAGNLITINNRAQITQPQMGESDGLVTMQMNIRSIPTDAGNDDLQLVFA